MHKIYIRLYNCSQFFYLASNQKIFHKLGTIHVHLAYKCQV